MLITDLMQARDYLALQREAARILNHIIERLNVRPMPDGAVRFSFQSNVALLDRLAVWGTGVEDVEGLHDDNEDGADLEPDWCAPSEPTGRGVELPLCQPVSPASEPLAA
ncbi:hypothetical protein U8607_24150 [Methylobacterium durans]|uniref:hypothetical protein n=1 Tax=Methylobacterium durans TaxID=2202825 RepID=UPI002AFEEE76|nr:hypothetical protein [Methylobacterium durans]MEA1835183.1 hypothetical protein [Methylobacterium durans]